MRKITDRTDVVFGSTKTYTASIGLSTCFRQWRASSHCNQLHGYALEFSATFEANELDDNNWVADFGGMKSFKEWLVHLFDHRTIVARDDPHLNLFEEMASVGICQLHIVDHTGCEALALVVFESLEKWLVEHYPPSYTHPMMDVPPKPRVCLVKLEVREHDGNSAYVRLANTSER